MLRSKLFCKITTCKVYACLRSKIFCIITTRKVHRSNEEKSPQNRIAYSQIFWAIFGYLCPFFGDSAAILWRELTNIRYSFLLNESECRFINRYLRYVNDIRIV